MLRVRRVQSADLAQIAAIESRCFSDPWSERAFRDALSHERIYFACLRGTWDTEGDPAEDGREHLSARATTNGLRGEKARGAGEHSGASRVLGYVVAWFAAGEGEIANLAVDPDLRGRGIGATLLDAALDEAAREGAAQVFLEVRSSNLRARQLYESRGFAEVGRRARYYRRPVEDAVVLRRLTPALATGGTQR